MDSIQIKDKKFTVSIKEEDILKEVSRVADEINRDLAGKNPLFLSVLNGSFMFTADLMKRITIPARYRSSNWPPTRACRQRGPSRKSSASTKT